MEETLRKLGLSNNEIKVFIALLELGTSKADKISKRSPLPRTTIYGLLKSLIERGLVSYVVKSGVKHYEATAPERLLSMEEEKVAQLKKIIPQLESLKQTIGERPNIEMYEGKEGVKSVYEDILRTKKTIYGYGNTKLLFELLQFYIPNYIQRRAKIGIKFQVITEKSKTSINMKKNDKKEKRETRFIDDLKKTTSVTYLYGDKTAILGLLKQQPVGVIIENKEFFNSQKIIFDLLWNLAKK